MLKRLIRIIPWVVFILTFMFLIVHLLSWDQIRVDNTTLVLLGILLISPFVEQVRKIKLGDFEAEIAPSEVKKIKEETERRLGTEDKSSESDSETKNLSNDLMDLLNMDHVLALAKLRMEIERALGSLYSISLPDEKQRKQTNINKLVSELVQREVMPSQLSTPIREVILLCNRAIHGESVSPDDAKNIVGIGIQVLEHIDSIAEQFVIEPKETKPLEQSEVNEFMNAIYRVSTVIPLVKNPTLNIRILDQQGLDRLLEGYGEYAEFLVNIEKIDSVETEGPKK